jgi:phage terminase small subunit
MMKKQKPLTPRQSKFVAAYLESHNAKAAALEAGYSPKTAKVQGCQLLKHPEVNRVLGLSGASVVNRLTTLHQLSRDTINKAEVTVTRIVQEAARLAFLDPGQFYDEAGNLLPVHLMPEDARRALSGMEVEEAFERDEHGKMKPNGALLKKIKFAPKTPALDLLARHMGMLQQPTPPAPFAGPNFNIVIHTEEPPGGWYPKRARPIEDDRG